MTPERWQQIGELFDAAVRIDPTERDSWLKAACAGDDSLRADVSHLLDHDERASREGLLSVPDTRIPAPAETVTWRSPGADRSSSAERAVAAHAIADDSGGFTPRPAIVAKGGSQPISEPRSVVQARLRELPLIYILIVATSLLWRRGILGHDDQLFSGHLIDQIDAITLGALLAIVGLLSGPWRFPLTFLKGLELGLVGMLAGRIALIQYRLMLIYSVRDDPMLAQLTMKNVVLLISIVILTYGLYVPKSWRRAALVVGPLALLPFAILLLLTVMHPEVMGWLGKGWRKSPTPRIWLFSFDAMILLILAVGSTFGARAISRLRRQVAEARKFGQYRLCQRLGAGGMGEVYLAEHQLLKRPCALKLIRSGAVDDPRAFERFEREVRLTATLSHPHTVDVYDYGRSEDGTYYYVMEYLRGLNLAELVERHGPLPAGRVVYLLRQVAGALREAHAAGLIHRDIKPSNIFAAQRGGMCDFAKLLDFGLVRIAATARYAGLSEEGRILGTPLFMSPEQAAGGRELDHRTDIYSLGAVAYYMLTSRPPFNETDGIAAIIAHVRDPVRPPSLVRPEIPSDLERVVMRCLAKEPSERFPDACSLERALNGCACSADWSADQASQWWQAVERESSRGQDDCSGDSRAAHHIDPAHCA